MKKRHIENYSYNGKPLSIGTMAKGVKNNICDVPGVTVGHYTSCDSLHQTGVTVIIPHEGNIFKEKLIAASFVINGFGKTCGTVQINELGTIETPIALTNTLNVGKVADALVTYSIGKCKKDGISCRSVNPVVGETNDSSLNRITDRIIGFDEVMSAIENASDDFEEGAVGAGRGTTCFGFKGGIGSASRICEIGNKQYHLGILVQSNFGATQDLCVTGIHVGSVIKDVIDEEKEDKGSIMMIVATDIPLTHRQMQRVLKRTEIGLARTGSMMGHGSGDVVIGFSTANRLNSDNGIINISCIDEGNIGCVFRAVAECCEEAVISSLINAETVTGNGNTRRSLSDYLQKALDRV